MQICSLQLRHVGFRQRFIFLEKPLQAGRQFAYARLRVSLGVRFNPLGLQCLPAGFTHTRSVERFQCCLGFRVGGRKGAGLFIFFQLQTHFLCHGTSQAGFLDHRAINLCRPCRMHSQTKARPLAQNLRNLLEFFLLWRRQADFSGFEGNLLQFLAIAAKQTGQRTEWRGHNFGQHIADRFPDNAAVAELRIIQTA